MPAIKSEKSGGTSGKGGGGGGKKGPVQNNTTDQKQIGPLHPALFMSNKRMMEILRCDEAELELLKHGAAKILAKNPKMSHRDLRTELSDQEVEWDEMLSGERWEGEEYPGPAGFEKDIQHVMIKLKGIAKANIARKKKKSIKKRKTTDADGQDEDRGGNGESAEEPLERRGVEGSGREHMMSGALRDDALDAPQGKTPTTFRRLTWLHKDSSSDTVQGTPRFDSPTTRNDAADKEGLYGASPCPPGRTQRTNNIRAISQGSPVPFRRQARSSRLFGEEDDRVGFVGVFDAAPRSSNQHSSTRGTMGTAASERTKTTVIDISSDSE